MYTFFDNVLYNAQHVFDNVQRNVQNDMYIFFVCNDYCALNCCILYNVKNQYECKTHNVQMARCKQIVDNFELGMTKCKFAHCPFHNVQTPENGDSTMCKLPIVEKNCTLCKCVHSFCVTDIIPNCI